MSVAGMTRAAFSAGNEGAENTQPQPNTPAAWMQAIADYIPSEVVGIYIFAVGVLNSPEATARSDGTLDPVRTGTDPHSDLRGTERDRFPNRDRSAEGHRSHRDRPGRLHRLGDGATRHATSHPDAASNPDRLDCPCHPRRSPSARGEAPGSAKLDRLAAAWRDRRCSDVVRLDGFLELALLDVLGPAQLAATDLCLLRTTVRYRLRPLAHGTRALALRSVASRLPLRSIDSGALVNAK